MKDSGLESGQAALTTALEALATRLTTLETNLANAATAAEVAALQTALATAQADLTELLASNNVYSDNLVINSAATLAVAKNLGGKLAIINGDVTITQSSSLSAADLQEVLDVMVTVTGDISYSMTVNSSTQATFDNLTSVDGLTLDVAGDINFPLLENAGVVTLNTTHKNYVTSVEFPVLSTVTSFYTGTTADAIDFPKATAITLTSLKNYVGVGSDLTIGGKLNFTLDLAALTSVKASGAKNAIDLVVKGAAELSLPEFTEGSIVAESTAKIVLPKFEGSASDKFTKATYLHLAAYEQALTMSKVSTSLDTLLFTGVVPTGADDGPSVNLTDATGLSTVTIDGTINALTLDGTSSLTEVSLTGKANAITVDGASNLEELTLGHTAADAELASLTVNNNDSLSSLTVSALVSAASLTITDNDALETLEFTALKTQGGKATAKANINISDNNLTASSIEYEVAASTDDKDGTGTIVTESGLDTLEAYIGAAATRYATTSGSIYVAFDTVELYTGLDGEPSTAPIEWSATSTPAETIIVDLKAATTTGDAAVAAVNSFTVSALGAVTIASEGVAANGVSFSATPANYVAGVDIYTNAQSLIANAENASALSVGGYSMTATKHWSGSADVTGVIATDNVSATANAFTDADTFTITATPTVSVQVGSKKHTFNVPALTSTATIYGVTLTAGLTDQKLIEVIASIANDMDNSQFDADTYSATASLSSTTDLGKYTVRTGTATMSLTADNQNPTNGLVTAIDVTITGAITDEASTAIGTSGTKFRLLELDYDELLITVSALNKGVDYDFSITGQTEFVPTDLLGADGKLYVATKEAKGGLDTYIKDNGGTLASAIYATKAATGVTQKENLDNYSTSVFAKPADSTVEPLAAAGTTNWSAWF